LKDINELMPKIPGMRWGAIINFWPTSPKLKMLAQTLPHDKRWHTVFETQDCIIVDDIPIVKKTKESMT
jgi:hypothetical protein